MPKRIVMRAITHPYWHCMSRAALTAMLRTIFVAAIAHHALAVVLIAEWFMSHRTSQNVGLRAVTNLPHFDRVWASGAVIGVMLGIFVTHLIMHPQDASFTDPRTWSDWHSIQAIKRLVAWVQSVAAAEPGAFLARSG